MMMSTSHLLPSSASSSLPEPPHVSSSPERSLQSTSFHHRSDPLDIPLIDHHIVTRLLLPRIIHSIRWIFPQLYLDWATGVTSSTSSSSSSSSNNNNTNSYYYYSSDAKKRMLEMILKIVLLIGSAHRVSNYEIGDSSSGGNDGNTSNNHSSITKQQVWMTTPAMRSMGMILRPKVNINATKDIQNSRAAVSSSNLPKSILLQKIIQRIRRRVIQPYSKLLTLATITIIIPTIHQELRIQRRLHLERREQQQRLGSLQRLEGRFQSNFQRSYFGRGLRFSDGGLSGGGGGDGSGDNAANVARNGEDATLTHPSTSQTQQQRQGGIEQQQQEQDCIMMRQSQSEYHHGQSQPRQNQQQQQQQQQMLLQTRSNERKTQITSLLIETILGASDILIPPLRLITYISYLWGWNMNGGAANTPDLGMRLSGWEYSSSNSPNELQRHQDQHHQQQDPHHQSQSYQRHVNFQYGNRRLMVEEALRTMAVVVPPRTDNVGGDANAATTTAGTGANDVSEGRTTNAATATNATNARERRTRSSWVKNRFLSFMGVVDDKESEHGSSEERRHTLICSKCLTENPTIPYIASCGHCYCYICLRMAVTDDLYFRCVDCGKAINSSGRPKSFVP